MKYSATSTNIHLLTLFTMLATVTGLFIFEFTPSNIILTLVMFYILNLIGNWMMLHRYFAHKSFVFKSPIVEKLFTLLAVLAGRGSPLGWTYIHRQHHAYSDTDKDPHSPQVLGYKLFGFGHYKQMESEQMKVFVVKDLMTKEHLFIHKYYMLIILASLLALSFVGLDVLYFAWIVPAFLVHLSQNNFNYFGHKYGYRNFDTRDNSRNNTWLFPIILGEAWHNNHHHSPKSYTTTVNDFEYDPVAKLIAIVGTIK